MISIGVLTISDSGAKGTREDTSGERIRAMVTQLSGAVLSAGAIIPDEREQIEATLREWSDEKQVNLILTTGGTGLAPRDVTEMALAELRQGQAGPAADRIAVALETHEEALHDFLRRHFLIFSELPAAYRLIKEIDFPGLVTTALDNLLDPIRESAKELPIIVRKAGREIERAV